jgi:hypothetical protein
MNEAAETAVEKLDTLITESQSQAEEAPRLFPLDQSEATVEIDVIGEDFKLTLGHRIKWPSLGALIEREQQTPVKTQILGPGKIKYQNDNGVTANSLLWDKFRSQVKGYEWNGADPDQWIDVSDELAAQIPSEHKSEAIVGLFVAQFEVERPKGKGYVLGAQIYRVKQTYGPYTIWHVFSKPSDRDRRDLARKSRETHGQPAAVKAKNEIFTNLKPYVELYDKLFLRLEGVTGADPSMIAQRKDLVNAIWKQGAINELMESFEVSRRD